MEFPHLGAHCSYASCNKLDFLPMKCDACRTVFCSEHYAYTAHACAHAHEKDVQVPECPLCGAPVPGRRGEAPDVAVGAHIDRDCQADPAKKHRNKVFDKRCSHSGCRAKEMVPLVCAECGLNYCLRHRHAADHACRGRLETRRAQAADAAASRMRVNLPPVSATPLSVRTHAATFAEIQGNMTEDEALAHALSLSLQADAREGAELARTGTRARVGGEQASRCALS